MDLADTYTCGSALPYQSGLGCSAYPVFLAVRLFFHSLPNTSSSSMAAAASVTTTAPSPPTLLKASPSSLISFRPVSRRCKHLCVKTKATENDQSAKKPQKVNSILCQDCEGNGAIACTKCEGSGVNSVDYFEGRFKAGALCWLCRGKREILCGNCNGAGFLGGFMSTFEETAQ